MKVVNKASSDELFIRDLSAAEQKAAIIPHRESLPDYHVLPGIVWMAQLCKRQSDMLQDGEVRDGTAGREQRPKEKEAQSPPGRVGTDGEE